MHISQKTRNGFDLLGRRVVFYVVNTYDLNGDARLAELCWSMCYVLLVYPCVSPVVSVLKLGLAVRYTVPPARLSMQSRLIARQLLVLTLMNDSEGLLPPLATRRSWLVRLVVALCALTIIGVLHVAYNSVSLAGVQLALLTALTSRAAMALLGPRTLVDTSARAVLMLMVMLNIIGSLFSVEGLMGVMVAVAYAVLLTMWLATFLLCWPLKVCV